MAGVGKGGRAVLGGLVEAWWRRRHPEWTSPSDGRVLPHFHLSAVRAPRYVYDRVRHQLRSRVHGPQPWITEDARRLLEQLLRPTDRGLEYGSGGTTWFFADRVEYLMSVEGFDEWYLPLAKQLAERGVANVALELASAERLGYDSDAHRRAYVNAHPELESGSLDFVFVDGEYRDLCAARGLRLLRSGGLLVLDNAETYLPSSSRSPWRVEAPATSTWEAIADETRGWRQVWTTNGVWDTVIWVKP